MIYLNHAGTTWPKPDAVSEAMNQFNSTFPDEWLPVFESGTQKTCAFFNCPEDRFLFTQSCTQSLAVAFSDFAWEEGDRLIISSMEHHALSRWYHKLQAERGVEGVIIPRAEDGPIDLEVLEEEMNKGVRMVAMTMASNVTGEILPFEEIIKLSKKYNAVSLLDGAQTAGLIPIDLEDLGVDIFTFAGHKGPLGPQGIGGLYISEEVSMICPSAACEIVPGQKKMSVFPSYCDTGSAPMITIAGLTAGLEWLNQQGWDQLQTHRQKLVDKMRDGLNEIDELEVVGGNSHGRYTGAVSIVSKSKSLEILKDKLWERHKIKGSFGFQCAPLAHEVLGTSETGTLRFSVGSMSTEEEVDLLVYSLKKLV